MENELIYLASPYSHPDKSVERLRFESVCQAAGRMMLDGYMVFSPIAHSHPIAMRTGLPTDAKWWMEHNRHWIDACSRLWVLTLDGWRDSEGVKWEIEYAASTGKLVALVSVWQEMRTEVLFKEVVKP